MLQGSQEPLTKEGVCAQTCMGVDIGTPGLIRKPSAQVIKG